MISVQHWNSVPAPVLPQLNGRFWLRLLLSVGIQYKTKNAEALGEQSPAEDPLSHLDFAFKLVAVSFCLLVSTTTAK